MWIQFRRQFRMKNSIQMIRFVRKWWWHKLGDTNLSTLRAFITYFPMATIMEIYFALHEIVFFLPRSRCVCVCVCYKKCNKMECFFCYTKEAISFGIVTWTRMTTTTPTSSPYASCIWSILLVVGLEYCCWKFQVIKCEPKLKIGIHFNVIINSLNKCHHFMLQTLWIWRCHSLCKQMKKTQVDDLLEKFSFEFWDVSESTMRHGHAFARIHSLSLSLCRSIWLAWYTFVCVCVCVV